ncbi:hypothetical protein [Arthrobacter glacialis]|nr:hypothetical protein [Arthrobacter glacialis]
MEPKNNMEQQTLRASVVLQHADMPRRGLTLLHTTRCTAAGPGRLVTFTSYVINEGTEPLARGRLVPMSLSNADMTQLRYIKLPSLDELTVGALAANSYVKWESHYKVTHRDVASGGPLISAMAATAVAQDGTELRDEADVVLEMAAEGDGA